MSKRNTKKTYDAGSVTSIQHNEQAGAEKNISVGPSLKPLKLTASTFTTDASTARAIVPGTQLAIFNNSSSVASVTLRTATGASLAAGAVDNTTGEVGVPCPPNAWSYISSWDKKFVITSSNTLMVFMIDDYSTVTPSDA